MRLVRCSRVKRNGERCKAYSVRGTTVCNKHGGSAPQTKAKAARRVAEYEAAEDAKKAVALFGAPKDVDPAQALLDLVHWTAGEVEYWRERVRALAREDERALTWGKTKEKTAGTDVGDTSESRPNVVYTMLYAAQDRLAQYAAAALKAGVAERQVRLAETQGTMVAGAVRAILESLNLSAKQWAQVPEVVPAQLRLLSGGQDK